MSTIPDSPATTATQRAKKGARWRVHARVFVIAILFGLGAYAVVQVLIAVTRRFGWLDWMYS